MASHLGRTVQEAQVSLTSTEFLKWIWYLNWSDTEEFRRQDYYLAQIAAQIERGQVKHPSRVTVQSKILSFTSTKRTEDKAAKIHTSKNFWLGSMGVRGKRKLPPPR